MKALPAERTADPDADLERQIADAQHRHAYASTCGARRGAWNELRYLISLRSPAQVARMEAEKGLA